MRSGFSFAVLLACILFFLASIDTVSAAGHQMSSLLYMQDTGDNDNDGILNFLDPDDDNDGVLDDQDPEPFNPAVPGTVVTQPTVEPVPTAPSGGNQPTIPTTPSQGSGSGPIAVVSGLPETGSAVMHTESFAPLLEMVLAAFAAFFIARISAHRLTR